MMKNRLKQLRLEKGLTLTDLAGLTGISESHLSRVEAGARGLRLSKLQLVARHLGVKPADLVGEEQVSLIPDLAPYTPPKGSAMEKAFEPSTQKIYKVLTGVLSELGITAGDPIVADESQKALKSLTSEQIVVVKVKPGKDQEEILMLRQYVRPNLLITNSVEENSLPLHIVKSSARIVGIVL
jgi:transcriptional regulator with XRE-family HTH domain